MLLESVGRVMESDAQLVAAWPKPDEAGVLLPEDVGEVEERGRGCLKGQLAGLLAAVLPQAGHGQHPHRSRHWSRTRAARRALPVADP